MAFCGILFSRIGSIFAFHGKNFRNKFSRISGKFLSDISLTVLVYQMPSRMVSIRTQPSAVNVCSAEAKEACQINTQQFVILFAVTLIEIN